MIKTNDLETYDPDSYNNLLDWLCRCNWPEATFDEFVMRGPVNEESPIRDALLLDILLRKYMEDNKSWCKMSFEMTPDCTYKITIRDKATEMVYIGDESLCKSMINTIILYKKSKNVKHADDILE